MTVGVLSGNSQDSAVGDLDSRHQRECIGEDATDFWKDLDAFTTQSSHVVS